MGYRAIHGKCEVEMPKLGEASHDACVTDPPYELGFMGEKWDASGVAFNPETWRAVYRVLKPGAFLLSFGGTRTSHRIACAIEDAGFEIRDTIMWVYGSGFPKSLDVSKAIDKAAGAEREVVGVKNAGKGNRRGKGFRHDGGLEGVPVTLPSTEAAARWEGWGTALKPAFEPIIVARKPLAGTVAENVLTYGTGALNIGACRIEAHDSQLAEKYASVRNAPPRNNNVFGADTRPRSEGNLEPHPSGRWPTNLILGCACEVEHEEGCAVLVMDEASGLRSAGHYPAARGAGGISTSGHRAQIGLPEKHTERGGASRFFYVAKATREERKGGEHPTVKPVALMRYLVRLVTPPGGRVLDPFAGTFKTGEAAIIEGFDFTGIEQDARHVATGEYRMARASGRPADPPPVKRRAAPAPLFERAE